MSSGATIGKGTTLGYSNTATGTYTLVGKVKSFKPPKVKSGKAETTSFDDPAEQFIPAFLNGGECGFGVTYKRPGTQTATLYALMQQIKWWQLTLPDGSIWQFEGFIDEYQPNVPLKEAIGDEINIVITGTPTDATPGIGSIPAFTAGT